MQGLADNPAIQLLSLIVGGFPARYLAAYCESGNLDANMRKASGDLATYYVVAAAILAIAALACPPLAIMSGLCGIAAGIFKALATGQPPNVRDVAGFLQAAGPAIQAFAGSSGSGLDMSKVGDAAGGFQAAASSPALAAAAGVAGGLPQLGAAPPSCHPTSAAERAAQRAIALASAKAKAKYKTAHMLALACAKVKAQQATARNLGKPIPPTPTVMVIDGYPWHVDPKCTIDMSTPTSTTAGVTPAAAKASSSSSKLAIAAAVALGAAKVFGVLG